MTILVLLIALLFGSVAQAATYGPYNFATTEDPLSDGGKWDGGYTNFGNMQGANGRGRVAALNSDERMTVNSISPGNDQYVQVKVANWNSGAATDLFGFIMLLRWAAPATATGIEAVILHDNSSNTDFIVVYEIVDGTETLVEGGSLSISVSANDVFKAVVSGTTLTISQNDNPELQVQVTSTSGRIGLGGYIGPNGAIDDFELDDYEGGDYGLPPVGGTIRHRVVTIE